MSKIVFNNVLKVQLTLKSVQENMKKLFLQSLLRYLEGITEVNIIYLASYLEVSSFLIGATKLY